MTENYCWVLADMDTERRWGHSTTHTYTVPGLALSIGDRVVRGGRIPIILTLHLAARRQAIR